MKVISSGRTWFYKKIFPVMMFGMIGAFIVTIVIGSRAPHGPPLPIIIFPLAMMGFFYFLMKKMIFDLADEVQDCDNYLMVRLGGQEEQIFLSNIINVSYTSMMNPPRATMTLRQPCQFGSDIAFIPLMPFSGFIKSLNFKNPIIDDLILRIDAARQKQR